MPAIISATIDSIATIDRTHATTTVARTNLGLSDRRSSVGCFIALGHDLSAWSCPEQKQMRCQSAAGAKGRKLEIRAQLLRRC